MKTNLPVTDHEIVVEAGQEIVSRTDLKGQITYVNQDFINISGFNREELLGASHNVVRHPDMPPSVFSDLWRHLKAGEPWSGVVKNRCKNGDYYWVRANVTPVRDQGRICGYMSVRVRAGAAETESAARLYRAINEGKAAFSDSRSKSSWNLFSRMRLWPKLSAALAILMVPLLALLVLLIGAQNEVIDHSRTEVRGIEYNAPLRELQQHLAEHRGRMNAYLRGNKPLAEKLTGLRLQIETDIAAVDAVNARYGSRFGLSRSWQAVRNEWATLHKDLPELTAEQSFARHNQLITEIVSFFSRVAESAFMTVDPDPDSSILVSLTSEKIMPLVDELGILRGIAAGLTPDNGLPTSIRDQLLIHHARAARQLYEIEASFRSLYKINPELKTALGADTDRFFRSVASFLKQTREQLLSGGPIRVSTDGYFDQATDAINEALISYDRSLVELTRLLNQRIDDYRLQQYLELGAVGLIIALALLLYYLIVRGIILPLKNAIRIFGEIAEGNFSSSIDTSQKDEIGDVLRALTSMQIRLGYDLSETRGRAQESLRVKVALDNVSGNVMVADPEGRIIYMNDAVIGMLKRAEEDIRQQLPDFDVDTLKGSNFDLFHHNPEHQQSMVRALKETYQARISIGRRSFSLTANPVIDENQQRLGTVVEWLDITERLNAEQQIETLISQAAAGDLDRRLDNSAYQGFMFSIAEGINQLLDAVVEPIKEIHQVLSQVAAGNLEQSTDGNYRGEFARLSESLNSTIEQLRSTVGTIRQSGTRIARGSSEIAQGNATLSQRTEEQAASLEETASSMEQMTSTVRQNADNASRASQLAIDARGRAERGGEVAGYAVEAMNTISQSSHRITEITGVIDEIAFQTNLLALNAAVEAARAGEQGRGFAVVAGEVRNLAQRSASAARDIKELIADSTGKVDEGARLVRESGKALEEIVLSAKQVSDIIAEIAAASLEQASGIEQVNKAIAQMDEVTQHNAALVEQTAAASDSMNQQAQQMMALMEFFILETRSAAAPLVTETEVLTVPASADASVRKTPPSRGSAAGQQYQDDEAEWEEF